jgi:hypothetical protein
MAAAGTDTDQCVVAVGSEITYWLTASGWVEIRAAASVNRANAGTDFDPVFFMIEARWFSTCVG